MARFEMQKNNAMKQLREHSAEGKTDVKIFQLLDFINSKDFMYSTSSCSGRITLLQTPKEHDKLVSEWLGKWHKKVTFDEVKKALSTHEKHTVYMQVECPIFHIVAKDSEYANKLVQIAHESGFKRSGIQNISNGRVVVEICSTENLEVPVADNGTVLVDDNYLKYLVDIANVKWESGQNKLERLEKNIRAEFLKK